jgi:hypothetical protein
VGVEGGTVTYRQNGTLLYASTVPPKYPLLVDTSLFASGSTVTAPVIFGDLGEYAAWTDRVGVSPSGINLTRAAGTGWNAGAVSSRSLASGDGYAEMTVASLTDRMMFGLSHGDTSQSYQDIDFAIYTYSVSGTLVVFENGSYRGSFGSYAVGDRLRVSVEGGKVVYRRNGAPFYTSSVAPIYPLLVDTSFYAVAGTIPGVMLCGPGWMADSVPAQDVDWVHLMGVTASGSTLTRPTGAGWDAGAVSHQSLAAGDGFAEFSVASMTDKLMFGLSRGDTDQSYQDIDFALYTYAAAGTLVVFENGSYRGSFGSYAVGDRLRVSVEGGKVTYRRNGALLYASTVAPTYPLQVDTSLASTGATIAGAMLGGALP